MVKKDKKTHTEKGEEGKKTMKEREEKGREGITVKQKCVTAENMTKERKRRGKKKEKT